MKDTNIGWCHDTVNFWWGCAKVSPACQHCYAELLAKLFSRGRASWGPGGLRWIRTQRALDELKKLQRLAAETGARRVFINSMSDTFEDRRDLDGPRDALFSHVGDLPDLRFLLLTKRPENVRTFVPPTWLIDWPENVWIGTTVENQECAERRIPELLKVPAKVRFLSCEPLLGELDFTRMEYFTAKLGKYPFRLPRGHRTNVLHGIHWVICGGESGAGHREMLLESARALHWQCSDARVPFFMKQDSGVRPGKQGRIPDELWVQELPA